MGMVEIRFSNGRSQLGGLILIWCGSFFAFILV